MVEQNFTPGSSTPVSVLSGCIKTIPSSHLIGPWISSAYERGSSKPWKAVLRPAVRFDWLPLTQWHMLARPSAHHPSPPTHAGGGPICPGAGAEAAGLSACHPWRWAESPLQSEPQFCASCQGSQGAFPLLLSEETCMGVGPGPRHFMMARWQEPH